MNTLLNSRFQLSRLPRYALYAFAGLVTLAVMVKTNFWIFGIAVIGLAFLWPRLRKRQLGQVEHSVKLRQITFAAQAVGILALAYPTRLWFVGLIALLILATGHTTAYKVRNAPPKLLRI